MDTLRQKLIAILKMLLLLICTVVFCLFLVEILLRLTITYKPYSDIYIDDFEIGKRLKPGIVTTRHYGSSVRINEHGMRDRSYSFKKSGSDFRILTLGDSWTFGVGVDQNDTWPRQLEKQLSDCLPGINAINTGVSGYETYNESIYYKNDLIKFEHDLVLVGMYPVNDIHEKKKKYEKRKRLHDNYPLIYQLKMYRKKNLYLANWFRTFRKSLKRAVRQRFSSQKVGPNDTTPVFAFGEEDWTLPYKRNNWKWHIMRNAILSIGETAREAGVPGAILLFPDLRDLKRYETYCNPRIYPLIKEAADEAGLVLIDLKDWFLPYAGREEVIALGGKPDATHPNAKGYHLMGKAIAKELKVHRLIPECTTAKEKNNL